MKKYPEVIEAEKKLISALYLKEGKVIPEVSTILDASDFYREEHRCIYRAIMAVYERGDVPDVLLVEEELKRTNELVKVNRKYLFALLDYEFTTTRAVRYAKMIVESAKMRQLMDLGEELIDDVEQQTFSSEELTSKYLDKLLLGKKQEVKSITIGEALIEVVDELTSRRAGQIGISTGYFQLDRLIGGMRKTDLIILAARPGVGKTAFALNTILRSARRGVRVLFFSLEMSRSQIVERLLSMDSGVSGGKMMRGELNEEDMMLIGNSIERLGEMNIEIVDSVDLSIGQLRLVSKKLNKVLPFDLIVIDYLQLMNGGKEWEGNRVQAVTEISRGLKVLARELEVPILALSQLSRRVEMRAEQRPQLSDLRESGSLEQDADIVLLLSRQEVETELQVGKNRHGATGLVKMAFNAPVQEFRELGVEDG